MNKIKTMSVLAISLLMTAPTNARNDGQMTSAADNGEPRYCNVYNMTAEEAKSRFATFKKTSATKTITITKVDYLMLGFFYDGRALVRDSHDGFFVIDEKGNKLKQWDKKVWNNNYYMDRAPHFSCGRLIVSENSPKSSYSHDVVIYDQKMHEVARFEQASASLAFLDGVAVVNRKAEWELGKYSQRTYSTFIDVNGNEILKNLAELYSASHNGTGLAENSTMRPERDGLVAFRIDVQQGNSFVPLWGFRDKTGKVVIEPKYDEVHNFSNGLCAVATGKYSSDRRWGFIDTKGNEVIPQKFSVEPSDFDECGLAVVIDKDRKCRVMNKKGQVSEKRYDNLTAFCKGRAVARIGSNNEMVFQMIDKNENVVSNLFRKMGFPENAMKSYDPRYATDRLGISGILIYGDAFYAGLDVKEYNDEHLRRCMLDANGDVVIGGITGCFESGLAPVIDTQTKEAGYVNQKGEWVVIFEESEF